MMRQAWSTTVLFVIVIMAVCACTHHQPPSLDPQPPVDALKTKQLLETTAAPQRDLVELVSRFSAAEPAIPRVARDKPWGFAIGDGHNFWVQNKGTGEYQQVTAELAYETPHAYWFVVGGVVENAGELAHAAEQFEAEIYPTNRRFFGQEWSPGVDGDPHLTILLSGDLGGGVSAYQNSLDEMPRAVFPYSNEMEMITLNAEAIALDDPAFACDLAHEFQHVIQWAADRDETTWLNELFGLLACPLNGLEAGYSDHIIDAFAARPDIQLNAWGTEPDQIAAQYGASQLFGVYFLERFGEQALKSWAADGANGLRSLDSALQSLDAGLDGDELFADWVVANYLDDPGPPDGGLDWRYGYRDLDMPPIRPERTLDASSLPVEEQSSVSQYAADYIVLNGPGQFQIDFSGEQLVRPVPAEPRSGNLVWWAGREQESDATLSHDFDLTGLDQATLSFYTWYDIDEGFDYAYVAISSDGHQWTALPGQTTVESGGNGVSLGPGYTGRSDGWIQEQIDLTPYAGQKVTIRFEYVTDDGPVRPGFLLDDIEIPELDYHHDAETDDGGWLANGFIRQANILPQRWSLQLITDRGGQTTIGRLDLGPDNIGRWQVDLGSGEMGTLIIAAITRDTAEAAGYQLRIAGPAG